MSLSKKRSLSPSSCSDDENPAKRIKREKNRVSAARSREKKSRMFQQMQDEIRVLTTKNGQLTRTLSLLTNQCQSSQAVQRENAMLREKIHALELQSAQLMAENNSLQMQASRLAPTASNHHQQNQWCCGATGASAPPIAVSNPHEQSQPFHHPHCQNSSHQMMPDFMKALGSQNYTMNLGQGSEMFAPTAPNVNCGAPFDYDTINHNHHEVSLVSPVVSHSSDGSACYVDGTPSSGN